MTISAMQALLARTMLRQSQADVSVALKLSNAALSRFESGLSDPPASRIDQIQVFYEEAGVEFTDGNGVRERRNYMKTYHGIEGFRAFMDDVYDTAKTHGGEICLFNSRPQLWYDWLGKGWYAMHRKRMEALGDHIRVRITVQAGEKRLIMPWAEHRIIQGDEWQEKVFYAYGPKLAFIDFSHNEVQILVLDEGTFADSYRMMFDIAWDFATSVENREAR